MQREKERMNGRERECNKKCRIPKQERKQFLFKSLPRERQRKFKAFNPTTSLLTATMIV